MLKIRLQRVGRRNDPSYRVVVVDSHAGPQSGKFVEILGSYDARSNRIDLQKERVQHWLSTGAQASPTVHNLLVSEGVVEGKKVNVLPKKSPIVSEKEEEAAPAAETPTEEGGEEAAAEEGSESAEGEGGEETPAEGEAEEPKPEAADESKSEEEAPAEESPSTDDAEDKEEAKQS